jgi:TctA family transporter
MIVQVLKLPTLVIMLLISLLCIVGAFATRNSLSDVGVMLLFDGVEYLMTLIPDLPDLLLYSLATDVRKPAPRPNPKAWVMARVY